MQCDVNDVIIISHSFVAAVIRDSNSGTLETIGNHVAEIVPYNKVTTYEETHM